jgi:hypothetical protein
MKRETIKNCAIGFLLGSCIFLLAGGRTLYTDGHCQSSLSSGEGAGEMYLAITNTSTGATIVHRFDAGDFTETKALVFDAESVNTDRLVVRHTR